MKTYLGVKIPKLNGRPQLWMRATKCSSYGKYETLRIIYPNGQVDYCFKYTDNQEGIAKTILEWTDHGCTSKATQFDAIVSSIQYDKWSGKPIFIGYL
jgi:hypothetical protein